MELVNEIVEARNFWEAWMSVRRNKGASGIDKMSVDVLDVYMPLHMDAIKQSICRKQYKPSPVRRVFIPKPNGKQRPLGIPTVVDRVVQQATAQVLNRIYEPLFSEHSYGFRPNRSCHQAINQALDYLVFVALTLSLSFDSSQRLTDAITLSADLSLLTNMSKSSA